jgi:hypothetical protein
VKSIPSPVGGRLTEAERAAYAAEGFVVRRDVFQPDEIDTIVDDCERLVDDLVRDRSGHRMKAGSYVFDPDLVRYVIIKWEGDTDVVHGIEPCAHLSPALDAWANDERFIAPMQDLTESDDPVLFTEKLNLKRPHHGGVNPMHQDYPYWVGVAEDPADVATAMLFLDDATLDNGCLHVVPGSHTSGVWRTRDDDDEFAGNEIASEAYPDATLLPLEMSAGSMVMFGSYLVHCSEPNRSGRPRRSLLFSYQPAGRPHMLDSLRKLAGTRSR